MKIKQVILRHMEMELKSPFVTSFGAFTKKEFILVEAIDEDGVSGWGESVAFHSPWYNEETVKTNWHMLEDFLLPLVLQKPMEHPNELRQRFAAIRKNHMAKSAIEGAVWDLYARKSELSLSEALGGKKKEIEVGISIGIQKSVDDLLRIIERYSGEGYRRIKMKIKPGWDVEVVREVRRRFPDLPLMADANSAYSLEDAERLQALDEFQLMMIEQPLAADDIVDHATLQAKLHTPICLDESIHSWEDAKKAIQLGSCKIINIKIGRVGGLTEAKLIHDLCQQHGIPVWCGGMLESGVGRAHNIALTTLENFVMPGDTAASSYYWERDIIDPEVTVHNGVIHVPQGAGIGYEVNRQQVDRYTVFKKIYDA
ncbi:o-succinylbenzoate synthase [Anoxybacillus rupiensis]|jgi:o-succinylbenzoate synthase|uniref:o-succinylbenzoate synthase n=1 Tax=Anoxybacteroides rupiense TaxID=311460 RepID=A0ABD5J0I8_9BACL|nr:MULTISPECIES: o-succinylbenzoate synthase [Anoxybacillus]KXG10274.1 o-succinylbenzoate synthase [Anoxybacillus sp. P3H1B]MBB3906440.1 O-succinylbenzoate synthase [Anoxybacillus rupiensis]MBS2770586.1 o-succinylbenzoate synthase [Anoxybacillus rupiensis]MDE8564301.1 o-succinylbenzoate synthase [Anoxybacillus rupiensis]MED5053515.1 o-succinylbenzoate synthase [Anoxybacillus rupiensis]